ncbi:MAG TPA: phosphate-starvation-inducible PsiE family protein [Acidimicrobiales bacterium]|nr:phosphate-starvation-inducible PsiE family protein [Acidimicrobiales bacterium]
MSEEREPIADPADRVLRMGENVVYSFVGVLLAAAAVLVLAVVAYHLVADVADGVEKGVTEALDGLLLVFILLELLAGVRATMKERKLVAEPFLVVGIIASIKEIVVLTLESNEIYDTNDAAFENAMTEIGVLAGVILLIALASFLVRRKEREPEEEDEAGAA